MSLSIRLFVLLFCPWSSHASSPTNVLFITADQFRFDVLGVVQATHSDYEGHVHVRTPNLDRLAAGGVRFASAYCQCPVCAPARGTLRTGCTLERTGLQTNGIHLKESYLTSSLFRQKVEQLRSLDQILAENGYAVEYYGKWHLPERLYYRDRNETVPAITYNQYDEASGTFRLESGGSWGAKYNRFLRYHKRRGSLMDEDYKNDPNTIYQYDTYSNQPYRPTALDARYGYPSNTPLDANRDLKRRKSQGNLVGEYTNLPDDLTPTAHNGDVALRALERLASNTGDQPFALTVSFHSPHAPFVVTNKYLDYYWTRRSQLHVPASIADEMKDSAYDNSKYRGYGFDDPTKLREWVAVYYALVEEVDHYVGQLLDALDRHGLTERTLVVFTADHGETLGAHALRGKGTFHEEATKVPLLMKLPTNIPPGRVVTTDVSHLDVMATVLDYLELTWYYNDSDGTSLKRFINHKSYNKHYDDAVVVAEWDHRSPDTTSGTSTTTSITTTLVGAALGEETNFMVKRGSHKLLLTKYARSPRIDMMYDLSQDPHELVNRLLDPAQNTTALTIGKAEHLKRLLMEWMERMDGPGYYRGTDPGLTDSVLGPFVDDTGESPPRGDWTEIKHRRSWPARHLWISDPVIEMGDLVVNRLGRLMRNEYFYLGHTRDDGDVDGDDLLIEQLDLEGPSATFLRLEVFSSHTRAVFPPDDDHFPLVVPNLEYLRIRVRFEAVMAPIAVAANLRITHDGGQETVVPIARKGEPAWITGTVPTRISNDFGVSTTALVGSGTSTSNIGGVDLIIPSNHNFFTAPKTLRTHQNDDRSNHSERVHNRRLKESKRQI